MSDYTSKARTFNESWHLAVVYDFVLFNQSRIKRSVWYWVRQNDKYSRISRGVYYKLSNCWQFANNVGSIIYSAANLLKPNIRRISLCSQVNPGERASLDDVRDYIGRKAKKQKTVLLALSQATALEICDRRITTGEIQNYNELSENDGTAACTFICLKITENV